MLYLAYMIGSIINLFYPASCQACGKKTSPWNKHLCEDCLKKIKKRLPPFCIKCGRQLSGEPHLQATCRDCKKTNPYFDRAYSVFSYDGILKELVHNFKYKKLALAKELMELTADFMEEYGIDKETDLVLSIPMHPVRMFRREINPSHIIAKEISKRLGIQYSAGLLKKTKNTPPQSKLKRLERIKNIKGSFSLQKNRSADVKYKNILLVDDLFTTGSTVNECARILKVAGSNNVRVVTMARGDRPL